jgi:hypothetical protein
MAGNPKWKFDPAEDEVNVLRSKCEKLMTENDKLKVEGQAFQKQITALKARHSQSKPVERKGSSIFLIIGALDVASRLLIYAVVEQMGTRAHLAGLGIWAVSGYVLLLMLILWAVNNFKEERWITAGTTIFLLIGILISVSIFDPHLLEDGQPGPVQHPVLAACLLIACLLIAATRLMFVVMGWLFMVLTDPLEGGQK